MYHASQYIVIFIASLPKRFATFYAIFQYFINLF